MPESKTPVRVINVEYDCDMSGCGGKVGFTQRIKKGIDPKVPILIHICDKCKKIYEFKLLPYPRQEFEPLNKIIE